MAPAYLKTLVPIRGSCLSNHTAVVAPSAPDYTPAWDTKIHVAFFDTRRHPKLYDIQMAAGVFNTSSVLLHVLLSHPRPVPGMRVTDVSKLPPLAACLHRNLRQLAHGPGPQYACAGKPGKPPARCPGGYFTTRDFTRAGRRFFSDCCTRDAGVAYAGGSNQTSPSGSEISAR